jgi:hypothetical protein
VNWYLTEDDGSNDGKFTDYLNKGVMRRYCPEVFDVLKSIAKNKDKSVFDIEKSGILPGTVFYSEILKPEGTPNDREQERSSWFQESMYELKDTELIFMDPDNGLLESDDATKLGGEKYILPSEVESYFLDGHNIVYYCHKGRRPYEQWEAHKSLMFNIIKNAKPAILTYHKGSQRSYIFLIHEKDFVRYRKVIDSILSGWYKVFSEEYTSKGNAAGELKLGRWNNTSVLYCSSGTDNVNRLQVILVIACSFKMKAFWKNVLNMHNVHIFIIL